MELLEDDFFSKLAKKRDVKNAKFLSHDEFWSKVS